ncbi:hypothetical protein C1932_09770 [Stenotrophomonas sp. YAU14D1_LEIMI4_1]|nr:hypothetical protein C1932_09770 [Stenotrophomonas sp. YAU14D1_LEIMI4_1]
MKLLRVTAISVCMLASAGCVQHSAPERAADTVCRSRLALHADACVEKAVASLKQIVQAREEPLSRCDLRSEEVVQPSDVDLPARGRNAQGQILSPSERL